MSEKIYLVFSIFYGILLQRIIGSFLEDKHNNSSNLHFRTKRMIGHTFLGHGEWMVNDVIHIVKVLRDDAQICAGVILSPVHILTPKTCAAGPEERHTVESGALHISPIETHHVSAILYKKYLSLLLIRPPIRVASPSLSRPISFAQEPLAEGMHLDVIAWGPTGQVRPITQVLIVNMLICGANYLHHQYSITQDNICTQLPENIRFFNKDIGSALVVGDALFGVLIRVGSVLHNLSDVFIGFNGNKYYKWIMKHIEPYLCNNPHPHNQGR